MDADEILKLVTELRSDLSKNPRQGREMLMWLQTLLLHPNDHEFMQEGLFPPSWLAFES